MRSSSPTEPVFRSLEVLTLSMLVGSSLWLWLLCCEIWLKRLWH